MRKSRAVSNYPNMRLHQSAIEATIEKVHTKELSRDNLDPIFTSAGVSITVRQLRKYRAGKGIIRYILRKAGV